jgi:gliding motility-associated-like protein
MVRLITLFFCLMSFNSFCQKEDYLWLFGGASFGIKFDYVTKLPSVIIGKYNPYSNEGCSVVCDSLSGKKLYYTNGLVVIDANNQLMPHGSGLLGNTSSAQNGMSAPIPGQCNRYFIFSNSSAYEFGPYGTLYYSIVDLNLVGNGTVTNPLGDIESVSKNTNILTNTSEAVTVVRGTMKGVYWIIVPMAVSSQITVLKITPSGIINTGIFDTGIPMTDIRNIRFSEEAGKFVIVGNYGMDPNVICNFDRTIGQISNPVKMTGTPQTNENINYYGPYDCEWSKDGTKLYYSMYRWYNTSGGGRLYQYDLNQPANPPALIYSISGDIQNTGRGLKRGPDNKIYWLYREGNLSYYVGVVNNPDLAGVLCNFNPAGLNVGVDIGNDGKFPEFISQNNTNNPPVAVDDVIMGCLSNSDTIFNILNNDIEPDGGPLIISIQKINHGSATVLADNTIKYVKPSSYSGVDTIWYKICDLGCTNQCDSAVVSLVIKPFANAGIDAVVCKDSVKLSGNGGGIWSVASGSGIFSPTANDSNAIVSGLSNGNNKFYWTITNATCGNSVDDVTIFREIPPIPDAGPDQNICNNFATLVGSGNGIWSVVKGTGFFSPSNSNPNATVSGLSNGINMFYWNVSGGFCGNFIDSITITKIIKVVANAGIDAVVCKDSSILNANSTGTWSVASGSGIFNPSANDPNALVSGLSIGNNKFYWTITNAICGNSIDSVTITKVASLKIQLSSSTDTICFGNNVTLNVHISGGSGSNNFLWKSSDNSISGFTDDNIVSVKPSIGIIIYYAKIEDKKHAGCSSSLDSLVITCLGYQKLIIPNLITPNEDKLNDFFLVKDVDGFNLLPGADFEVYNRWGENIYKSDNYSNNWNANNVSDGIYYYILRQGCDNHQGQKGWLQIIR